MSITCDIWAGMSVAPSRPLDERPVALSLVGRNTPSHLAGRPFSSGVEEKYPVASI